VANHHKKRSHLVVEPVYRGIKNSTSELRYVTPPRESSGRVWLVSNRRVSVGAPQFFSANFVIKKLNARDQRQ
jgi:hypothetical protein